MRIMLEDISRDEERGGVGIIQKLGGLDCPPDTRK